MSMGYSDVHILLVEADCIAKDVLKVLECTFKSSRLLPQIKSLGLLKQEKGTVSHSLTRLKVTRSCKMSLT